MVAMLMSSNPFFRHHNATKSKEGVEALGVNGVASKEGVSGDKRVVRGDGELGWTENTA